MATKKRPAKKRPRSAASRPSSGPAKGAGAPSPGGSSRPAAVKTEPKPKAPSKPTRAERLAAAERARRRQQIRARALVGGITCALVLVVLVVLVTGRRGEAAALGRIEASGACTVDERFDSDLGSGRNHTESPLSYTVDPPSGGDHSASPAPAGTYTDADVLPDSRVVHSLEHGYIAVWLGPGVSEADRSSLRSMADRHRKDVLLLPRPTLGDRVAATAWHRRAVCSRADAGAIEEFVEHFVNKGPEEVVHR